MRARSITRIECWLMDRWTGRLLLVMAQPYDAARMSSGWYRKTWIPTWRRCPECGSTVITRGEWVWCTYVGDPRAGMLACKYGVGHKVRLYGAAGSEVNHA